MTTVGSFLSRPSYPSSTRVSFLRHRQERQRQQQRRTSSISSVWIRVVLTTVLLLLLLLSCLLFANNYYDYHYTLWSMTTSYSLSSSNNNNNSNDDKNNTYNNTKSSSSPLTKILPSWDELDTRVPSWYDEVKFGIFIHWGVFSVPSYGTEWFWEQWMSNVADGGGDVADFVNRTERPNFSYTEYASRFTAELYNATEWTDVFERSGAQYVVLTSKHHEGYCMWDSRDIPTTWNWNVMDVGPRRDVLGELAEAVKKSMSPYHTKESLKFGVYHSLYEWYNLLYLSDKANNYTTQQFVDSKTLPELYDLVNKYQPELIWSDGEWEADSTYWKAREFLNWYSTESAVAETAVWNDRWGTDVRNRHGTFFTGGDRYDPHQLQNKKFEDCFTIDQSSWGYNRYSKYHDYLTVRELIHTLIEVVAYNGNVLINVGPAADGTIHPIFVDRLMGIGKWLSVNGEAIYKTRPWDVCQNETDNLYYTKRDSDNVLYAHITKWPENRENVLILTCPVLIKNKTMIRLLGYNEDGKDDAVQQQQQQQHLKWEQHSQVIGDDDSITTDVTYVFLPTFTPNTQPCEHAWVLAIENIANLNGTEETAMRSSITVIDK